MEDGFCLKLSSLRQNSLPEALECPWQFMTWDKSCSIEVVAYMRTARVAGKERMVGIAAELDLHCLRKEMNDTAVARIRSVLGLQVLLARGKIEH